VEIYRNQHAPKFSKRENRHALTEVWISFSRHSPNWRVDHYFHLSRQKPTGQKYRKVSERGKKPLANLASGFVFLLANPEFY
jgi:hypothetical protein